MAKANFSLIRRGSEVRFFVGAVATGSRVGLLSEFPNPTRYSIKRGSADVGTGTLRKNVPAFHEIPQDEDHFTLQFDFGAASYRLSLEVAHGGKEEIQIRVFEDSLARPEFAIVQSVWEVGDRVPVEIRNYTGDEVVLVALPGGDEFPCPPGPSRLQVPRPNGGEKRISLRIKNFANRGQEAPHFPIVFFQTGGTGQGDLILTP